MTTYDTIGRTLAAIALTIVASATMLLGAVAPAQVGTAAPGGAIVHTIA